MENLEQRQLLSITVTSIIADNRAKVLITLNPNGSTIDASTVTKSSALIYTPGTDGLLNTADDVRLAEAVLFNASANRITLFGKLRAGTAYRVRLIASRIKTIDNQILDGEFTSTLPSGNGSAGGDFNAQTKLDKTITPTIRVETSLGTIVFKGRMDVAPKTTGYFIGRANAGFFDNTWFTNNVRGTGARVGGGAVQYFDGKYNETSVGEGKTPEVTGLSNVRGAVALDRLSIAPGKEGNGFFFNAANNATTYNGKFSAFGTVVSGLAVIDAINALTPVDISDQHFFALTDTHAVPVLNPKQAQDGSFTPLRDAVVIKRVAVQMRVTPFFA